MEGITEKDCSPLWNLYQQVVSDMKNSAPMWEEFISKATKLHSALKSALVAIASFLDAFQKIADAATNARGATKEIGTALTRVCLRHRAIETRMKTFISTLMDTLINPLSDRAEEWRRGGCSTGALSREHARECKRARAELRRKVQDAQRHVRKARRAAPDSKKRADVCVLDVQERKQQLEEMEEKAVKAALVEERSRFCHFVSLFNPVVESEVAMLAEVGHLQEGSEQLVRHTAEPRTLPAASLQVICDIKSCYSGWAESASAPHSPSTSSRLGSRKSSLTSISSLNSQCSEQHGVSGSTVSCSTPISNASSSGTLPPVNNDQPHCLSQGSDTHSVSSECANSAMGADHTDDGRDGLGNTASATWPDLKDTAQFERAASAIMGGRPHTISAAYESRGHARPALSVHTFTSEQEVAQLRDNAIYARPPLPTRCSSLERPLVPAKTNANTGQQDMRTVKPSSLPPHLTKEIPAALYVNMSELATMAASRAQMTNNANHEGPHQEKVCSESSASESSLESSSGYGSQGAFANEDHTASLHHQMQHTDDSEIVTLRRSSEASLNAARESFSISLGSLEEAVKALGAPPAAPFATIGKKPAPPLRRPLSLAASPRRVSVCSLGRPPPPIRRSSSISRPNNRKQSIQQNPSQDADNLPPPPAFLLQPDNEANSTHQTSVAETVKQLTELKHMPASPSLSRRNQHTGLSTFQLAKGSFTGSNMSLNATGNLNPIYGQTGHRIMQYVEQNSVYVRKSSMNASSSDLYRELSHGDGPAPPVSSYGDTGFSSFGQRGEPVYGTNAPQCGIYASVSPLERSPRHHSADRRREQSSLIASLSAKLAPQLSPRTNRRAISTITPAEPPKGKSSICVEAGFLDKLSATLSLQQQRHSPRAHSVRDIINKHAQPDPRVCHTSLMEQIKRGATLKRNKQCNDRSAPKIR